MWLKREAAADGDHTKKSSVDLLADESTRVAWLDEKSFVDGFLLRRVGSSRWRISSDKEEQDTYEVAVVGCGRWRAKVLGNGDKVGDTVDMVEVVESVGDNETMEGDKLDRRGKSLNSAKS